MITAERAVVAPEGDLADALGLFLLLWFSAFSAAAVLLAALGWFRPVPLALLTVAAFLAVAAAMSKGSLFKLTFPGKSFGLVTVLLCVAGSLFSPPAQFIIGGWDAGVYYNTGVALAESGSLTWQDKLFGQLPADAQDALADSRPNIQQYLLPGFYISGQGEIHSNFPMLLSIWVGLFKLIGGNDFALFAPPVLAVLAVFWFFLFARLILGVQGAFIAAVLLSTNAVQIWHARQTLSETLLQGMIFGGMAAALLFLRYKRPSAALSSGLVLGILPLVKTEAVFVSVLCFLPIAALALKDREINVARRVWLLAGYLAGAGVSAVHYLTSARVYVLDQIAASGLYIAVGALLVIAGFATSLIIVKGTTADKRTLGKAPNSLGALAAIGVTAAGWAGIASIQSDGASALGLALSLWDGLFLSPLDGLLLLLGLAFLVLHRRSFFRGGAAVPTLLMALFIASLLYLAIYARYYAARDEIPLYFWATRRLMPIVLPLVSLLIAFSITRLAGMLPRGGDLLMISILSLAVLLRLPDTIPVVKHTEYRGATDQIGRIAGPIGQNSVLLFDNDDTGLRLSTPLRSLYHFQSYIIWRPDGMARADTVMEYAKRDGSEVFYLTSRPGLSSGYFEGFRLIPVEAFTLDLPEWERTSEGRPSQAHRFSTSGWIFRVEEETASGPARSGRRTISADVGSNDQNEYLLLDGELFAAETSASGETYRWTGRKLKIKVPVDLSGPATLRFRAAGGRPEGALATVVEATCGSMTPVKFVLSPGFEEYQLQLPAFCASSRGKSILFSAEPRGPGDYRAASDARVLGFMLDWMTFEASD